MSDTKREVSERVADPDSGTVTPPTCPPSAAETVTAGAVSAGDVRKENASALRAVRGPNEKAKQGGPVSPIQMYRVQEIPSYRKARAGKGKEREVEWVRRETDLLQIGKGKRIKEIRKEKVCWTWDQLLK